MLQKYERRNGIENNFIPPFNVVSFNGKVGKPEELSEKMNIELPSVASAGDVREIVKFLSRRNGSIRNTELQTAEPRRIFETEKLAAYETWGIIIRDENYIRLSDLGLELAKRNTFEKQIYRRILSNLPQYYDAVEWMSEQNLKIITFHDLSNFWEDNFPGLVWGEKDLRKIETAAVSFFSICHAAELGILTVGKRGQPNRLSIDGNELKGFLNKGNRSEKTAFPSESENNFSTSSSQLNTTHQIYRVYISHGRRKKIDNLVELLELTGFETLIATDVESENSLFNPEQISQIQKCHLGLFILHPSDCRKQKNGNLELRNEKIIEINTALALFKEQIILFWDSDETPPQILSDT